MKNLLLFVLPLLISKICVASDFNFELLNNPTISTKPVSTSTLFINSPKSKLADLPTLNLELPSINDFPESTTSLISMNQDLEINNSFHRSNFSHLIGYSTKKDKKGNKVGRFILGAIIGGGCGVLACVLTQGEETYSGSGDYTDNSGKMGAWMIGGAIGGGILMVIDF